MTSFTFTTTLPIAVDTPTSSSDPTADTEVEVTYSATPYIPATSPTYACGGQPAEGGEVELLSVTANGVDLLHSLTPADTEELEQAATEHLEEDFIDLAADYADYLAEQRADDRWEEEHEQ